MRKIASILSVRNAVFTSVLLAFLGIGLIRLQPVLAAGVQPMGILRGSTVKFEGGGGEQFLPSFCLDESKSIPDDGLSFNNFSGDIRLTFNNGEVKNYDLSNPQQRVEAFRHFRIEGTGDYEALRFVKTSLNLKSIEFQGPGLAYSGDLSDFNKVQRYLQTFEALTSTLPRPTSRGQFGDTRNSEYIAAQKKLWANPHVIDRVPGEKKSITFDYINRDPHKTAIQQIINLDGRGDAILVQYGTVNLLIDSGMTSDGFARIAPKLPKDIRLDILLTHRDQDHIGNVKRLLEMSSAAGIRIENIFMSTFEVPAFNDRNVSTSATLRQLLHELQQRQYVRRDLSTTSAMFSLPGSTPILQEEATFKGLLKDAKKDVASGGIIAKLLPLDQKRWLTESADSLPAELHEISLSPDLKIQVFQKTGPKSANESSLVTKIVHNRRSTLYTGDMNENAMEDLLAFETSMLNFGVDIAYLQSDLAYLKTSHPAEYSRLATQLQQTTSEWEAGEVYYRIIDSIWSADAAFKSRMRTTSRPSLAANTLKWPHHAWLPRSNRGKEILKRFIDAVDPETIVFSISPETSELKFSATEFVNAEKFVTRLKAGGDPLSTWLRQNFSQPTQTLVSNYEGGVVSPAFQEALAQELTRLIKGPLIYSADRFSQIDLADLQSRLTGTLAESDKPILNRQLLETAYPGEIGQIRGQNVEKVKAFLREAFPYRKFNIVMTPEGDIKFLTLNQTGTGFDSQRARPYDITSTQNAPR